MKKLLLFSIMISMSGCLLTRNEIEEVEQRKVVQTQVSSLQKNNADSQSRFNEFNEELRELNGKIEALDNRLVVAHKEKEKSQNNYDQQLAETNKKVQLLQEEVQKLENQVAFLNQELVKASSSGSGSGSAGASAGADKKEDSFQLGEEKYAKKEWREAILQYQKYRENFPKGRRYVVATVRMGQCFAELGMKDEAKEFFQEVITKYPDNPLAKQAKERLKKMR